MTKLATVLLFLLFCTTGFSQLVISEIMQNPDEVTDANGEWFELYNPTGSPIDINGWRIFDNGSDSHVITNGGALNVPAGGFLVLGRNGDTGTNGNLPVDYVFSGTSLGNGADELVLEDDSVIPVEIDRVEWDGGTSWPDPTGASMVFTGDAVTDNNVGANWTTATSRESNYGAGSDLGSPGSNGSDQALPIELSSFVAIGGDNEVILNWSTASEIDNQGFAIMRSAAKDGEFDEIDSYVGNSELKGAGTSSNQNDYTYIDESVFNGETYWYKLVDIDMSGVRTEHGPIYATPHSAEVKEVNSFVPADFAMYQNKPNPFNPSTTIKFDVPALREGAINVSLTVYNLLGQKVATLYEGVVDAGTYETVWNGLNDSGNQVPSGIYVYQIVSENFSHSMRMTLVK
ncbi:MAG: T9SS C-terminal target domain-containing protein [Calditrichaeota bacterium]|nr:MAG: T9SS C-terminal target domain-containing protein [Calditrichota bacterium]MBL1206140.1 T9SS C-terminal target domain-containing protein [Calditrichota bacterium]NOG45965.1 T9SS type A sorting domain-containing protein [Calditrichota bacterium]